MSTNSRYLSPVGRIAIPLSLALLSAAPAAAQRQGDSPRSRSVALAGTTEPGIAWYGILEEARLEARRTGKPILIMSGAPACTGVPGMW